MTQKLVNSTARAAEMLKRCYFGLCLLLFSLWVDLSSSSLAFYPFMIDKPCAHPSSIKDVLKAVP